LDLFVEYFVDKGKSQKERRIYQGLSVN